MQQLSARFDDRPMTPQQSIIYWTNYVVKYNGALHLRPVASDMPLYQYFLIDILLFLVFGLIIFCIILRYKFKLIYRVSSTLCYRKKQPWAKKKN